MEKIETQSFYKELREQAGLGEMSFEEIQSRLQLSSGRGGQVLIFNARGRTAVEAQRIERQTFQNHQIGLSAEARH